MRSQSDKILAYLATGKFLTPLDAFDRFGTFRLAARIHELRGRGHDIRCEVFQNGGKRYSEYWLAYPVRAK